MNLKQKAALWLGVGCILAMLLFPPWIAGFKGGDGDKGMSVGRNILFLQPTEEEIFEAKRAGLYRARIDGSLLLIQTICISLATGGAALALKDQK